MSTNTNNPFIHFTPVTESQIREYITWRYEPPYDIYNENPYQADEVVAYYLDPQIQAHAITGPDNTLIGICTFGVDGQVPGGRYHIPALDIGLAINPAFTGRGLGSTHVQAVINYAWSHYNSPALRVTIAQFNHRAQRVWEKAGFTHFEHFNRPPTNQPFIIYLLHPPPPH